MTRTAAFDAWVDEARRIPVADALQQFPHTLKRAGRELVGPCPACGGRDRFSVNLLKNVWYCRRSAKGGDAIALVEYLSGCDFIGAVEMLTGRGAPTGEKGQGPDPKLIERRRQDAEIRERDRELEAQTFRAKEIRRAHEIWTSAAPITGSVAEAYLRCRGLSPAPAAKIRSMDKLPFWHFVAGAWKVVHEGPAMVAAIQGRDDRFIGAHCTWIDLSRKNGKAEIADPETGELLPSKKVRGSAKGGHIHLGGPLDAARLVIGEGIETTYAVRESLLAERAAPLPETMFWASISLGNIGGRATESVCHPTATLTDSRGRVRRGRLPGPVPDLTDTDVLMPPDGVVEVTILGDGDSDRLTTANALLRAAARWAKPGRVIKGAWADVGGDFNDMLRGAA